MSLQGYSLGLPVWSNRVWVGDFFTVDAQPADFLRQYSAVFNTVEGNTTFYGLPAPATVRRWRDEPSADFRFCFKFPRAISHERRLRDAGADTTEFLRRLEPLAERLGPLLLQLPPGFGPSDLAALDDYLATLPRSFSYAVEVRHADFFVADGGAETALNALLTERGVDRALLDSRALFSEPARDADTREAQRKKPRLPVRAIATGSRPLIRFIGHPDVASNRPFLEVWVDQVAAWIGAGRHPHVFTHTPNNRHAPALAGLFHGLLRERLAGAGELPPWPGAKTVGKVQMDLF